VGITLLVKPGAELVSGAPVLRLTYRHPARLEEALRVLDGAITISDDRPAPRPLVIDRVG
ncbi:MAG: hypothetical protein WD064_05890, partial [Acidimicrobiia bacterium]